MVDTIVKTQKMLEQVNAFKNAAILSDKEIALLKATIAPYGTPDEQIKLAFHVANQLGLDPLRKQVMVVKIRNNYQVIIGVHGMSAVIAKHPDYRGTISSPVWPGEELVIDSMGHVSHKSHVLDRKGNPVGAWATTVRNYCGYAVNHTSYLRWEDYAKMDSDSWQKQGPWMIEKTARAFSMRTAFPDELYGVYAKEEFNEISEPIQEEVKTKVPATEENVKQMFEDAEEERAIYQADQPKEELPWEKEKTEEEWEEIGLCHKCGYELITYTARNGKTIKQCQMARDSWKKSKDPNASKGHFYKVISE